MTVPSTPLYQPFGIPQQPNVWKRVDGPTKHETLRVSGRMRPESAQLEAGPPLQVMTQGTREMSEFVFPLAMYGVPAVSDEKQASSEANVLPPDALEHGAYYTGQLGPAAAIARWHANKRRFVFGEYSLGSQRIRAVSHIADGGKAEVFAPLSMTQPKGTQRVSEYAFETAG